jgi:hypothetical protein
MSQKFAIPAFFPILSNSAPCSVGPHHDLLVSQPSGSIIVLGLDLQDTNPRPDPTNPTNNAPWRSLVQCYQTPSPGLETNIVLGYVDTDFGKSAVNCSGAFLPCTDPSCAPKLNRSQAQIINYIDYWYQMVPALDGIFFDDGPELDQSWVTTDTNGVLHIAACVKDLYAALYKNVLARPRPGRPVVGGNSGGAVLLNASQYQEDPGGDWIMAGPNRACDIAILWETEACHYFFNWPRPPLLPSWWRDAAYASRISHTIFDCHNAHQMQQVVALSKKRAGPLDPSDPSGQTQTLPIPYVYVIDSNTASYDHVPPYWNTGTPNEVAEVGASSTSAVPPTPSSACYNFYVRDWTASSTSHDMGQEPSTNPVFYTTSDVWNKNSPQPTGSNPFNSFDQPITDNVLPRPLLTPPNDSNFAYVRIARNPQTTDAAVAVAAQFLWADFGMHTNFQYANKDPNNVTPSPVFILFTEGESQTFLTDGFAWNIPSTHSDHVCLAVEISNACDRVKVPLTGGTPGGNPANPLIPDTDPSVLNDNNLAQRNLVAIPTPMGSRSLVHAYAIVHNGALFPRDIEINYEVAPEAKKALEPDVIEIIDPQGKQVRRSERFTHSGKITLEQMQPGENRWIGVSLLAPKGSEDQLLPVLFYELAGDTVLNGFAIAAQPSPLRTIVLDNLKNHAMKFLRLAAAFKIDDAEEEGKAALHLFRKGTLSTPDYLHFLQLHVPVMSRVVYELGWSQEAGDPFGIRAPLKHLMAAATSGNADHAATTHSQVLQKLDAFLTMLQKTQGDIADILQMVRWQRELYSTLPLLKAVKGAHRLIEESQAFITAYRAGQIGNDNYPGLISNLLHIFHQTAEALEEALESEAVEEALELDIATMERHIGSLTGLQRAHREYLLKLQRLGNKQ